MKVIPKEDYVHIKTFDKKNKGRIIIPKKYRKKFKIGEVLSVHPNETELSPGNNVFYIGRPAALLEDESIVVPKGRILMKVYKK